MLRSYGPLAIAGVDGSFKTGHVRTIYGIQGDENPESTTMLILDPFFGTRYGESYEKFYAGFDLHASDEGGLIAHF